MDTPSAPLASIGIDIGKEVFHVVGFGTDGKIAFRRKIKRLASYGLPFIRQGVKRRRQQLPNLRPLRPRRRTSQHNQRRFGQERKAERHVSYDRLEPNSHVKSIRQPCRP
jgi:hypothetical protein